MLACGALLLIAGLQLLLPGAGAPAEPPGLAARRTRLVATPRIADFSAVLAAPLFAPDRRPGDPGGASVPGNGTLAGYAALGAAAGRTVATAIVADPSGKVATLRRGEVLDGWSLVAVSPNQVTFERGGLRETLVVGAKPSTATAASGSAGTDGQ